MRRREPASIDPLRPFNELGIDSLDAITLTGELERDLGCSIDPAVILEHPTPHAFAIHLASRTDHA
ncbi:MAG: acyl carrier protein [Planctomycetes bacterium]|nr:acyl carrier protein [Planctomycetota bacterium]